VRRGADVRQLAAAPELRDGKLWVPLQFVSEVLPHFARTNLTWDQAKGELRLFTTPQVAPVAPVASRGRAGATAPAARNTSAPARASTRRTVVVDAGHGGPDRGMQGPVVGRSPLQEKHITLEVAKRVGEKLRARGVDIVYTRTRDTLIALSDRGRIANEANGVLFLSIHVNAANPTWAHPERARGFETYFLAEARTEDARRVEQMENESIRFETEVDVGKGDPLSFILNDMAQNEHLRESSELAELVQQRMAAIHPGPNRGVKQAGFRVLVTAFMPAVLVELGFGTNPEEAAFLASAARQDAMAKAIADAALEYLERYERRVGGGAAR
jgi:N-acetylmuramoyl-L-alanine amidase